MREENGDNILVAAIYNKHAVQYKKKFNAYREFAPESSNQEHEMNAIFDNLLEIGTDYLNINNNRESLLHIAVNSDNLYVVKKLIELRVPANSKTNYGNRPIHLVSCVEVFKELRRAGGADDLNVRNNEGQTPLHTLVYRYKEKDDQFERHFNICDQLISEMIVAGANINAIDNDGNTPFHFVGNVGMAKALLANGANINAINFARNNVALSVFGMLQESENDEELMKFLVSQKNIDLLAHPNSMSSMLSIFVNMNENDFNEILPELSKRSAQIDELFRRQCNAINFDGEPDVLTALMPRTNSFCLKKLLVLKELKINEHSLLAHATSVSDFEAVKILLSRGADLNQTHLNHSMTPLMLAISEDRNVKQINDNKVNIALLVIETGANTEIKDEWGATAIEYARCL